MADLFLTPSASRFVENFSFGDYIDVVSWPASPNSTTISPIPANTLLVMPFLTGYYLSYDALNYISSDTANITWGLYSYEPNNRAGTLLNSTGQISISGSSVDREDTFSSPGILYPGRTYAIAVNSSAPWNMRVHFGNGTGSSRIIGGRFNGGFYENYTHLQTNLTYNAALPSILPFTNKSDSLWAPNPLFRVY